MGTGPSPGEGGARVSARQTTRCRRRSSSSATGNSRSTAFATPTSPSWTKPRCSCRPCVRTAARGTPSPRASDRCRRFWRSSTRFLRRLSPARPPQRVGMPSVSEETIVSPTHAGSPRTPRSRTSNPRAPFRSSPPKASRPPPVSLPTRLCVSWPEPSCGTGRPAHRGSASGRHRHPLPLARQPSRLRDRARSARRLDVRLQGPRILRRRRNPGRGRAAEVPR